MAGSTDLQIIRIDSTTIDAQREDLIAAQLVALQGLIATAKDEKVRLGAIAELNRMLSVGSYKPSTSNKQVNNFLGDRPAASAAASAAVAARLQARVDAPLAADAIAETAAVLAGLEDADDD